LLWHYAKGKPEDELQVTERTRHARDHRAQAVGGQGRRLLMAMWPDSQGVTVTVLGGAGKRSPLDRWGAESAITAATTKRKTAIRIHPIVVRLHPWRCRNADGRFERLLIPTRWLPDRPVNWRRGCWSLAT